MLPRAFTTKISLRKAVTLLFVFAVAVFCLLAPEAATFAQEVNVDVGDQFGTEQVQQDLILDGTDIRVIIMRIIRAILSLTGVVLLGIVLYGGFLVMTSQGAEDKIATGRQYITNAVIGLAIVLMSVAIVTFVIGRLSEATGSGFQRAQGGLRAQFNNFAGSGSLGEIVKDHHPFRHETGIKRNTRIVVTFAETIAPGSLIENTNNTCWGDNGQPSVVCEDDGEGGVLNPYYGDCIDPGAEPFNFAVHCDQVDQQSIEIFKSADVGAVDEQGNEIPVPLVTAAAMTTYDDAQEATTFIFRPLEPLGNDREPEKYTVRLNGESADHPGILKSKDGVSAFVDDRDGQYFWEFETDTTFDFSPPHVVDVYPSEGAEDVYRNNIIQITFNEPIDPAVAQGPVRENGGFTNIIFRNRTVTGEWKISNGYRTIEFIPTEACGSNSCGETMYCLATTCDPADLACTEEYGILLRTADLINPNGFEARPMTGITDMAGNALDGRSNEEGAEVFSHDGNPDGKPLIGADPKRYDAGQTVSDNFWWTFKVINDLDLRLPYIEAVRPFLDEGAVAPDAPVTIDFSMPMWYGSLQDVDIEEYPGVPQGGDELPDELKELRALWTRTVARRNNDRKTVLSVQHRAFGPNNFDLFYYPNVPGTVKAANQNCLYPGQGPLYDPNAVAGEGENRNAPRCTVDLLPNGDLNLGPNCVPVVPESEKDTGCVWGGAGNQAVQANVGACLEQIRANSPRLFVEPE